MTGTQTQPQSRREARGRRTQSVPSPPGPVQKIHFTAIDGARGLAIASVLLYHSGWSERGLFGVDAFFVISGFLITFLLLRELNRSGRIGIGRFYARRAKRLLPALLVTLAGTLIAVWALGSLDELRAAATTALFSLAQVANWQQIFSGGAYWEQTGQIVPLGQMWSLSVTEQFYIVWPLLMIGLWFLVGKRPGRLVALMFVVLVASALVAPILFTGANIDRLYLGTDTRAVAFVAGAAFAGLVTWIATKTPAWAGPRPSAVARLTVTSLSALMLIAIVGASLATTSYRDPWLYQGGLAVVSVMIAAFTATLCFRANSLSHFFSWKPFTSVGVMSYSLFLLHLPIYWIVQRMTDFAIQPLGLFVIGGLLTWLCAVVLHHLIAEPLRTRTWTRNQGMIAAVAGFGVVVLLAVTLPAFRGTEVRSDATAAAVAEQESGQGSSGIFALDPSLRLPQDATTTVALIGDSVAGNMYAALDEFGSESLIPVDVSWGGCGILDADAARASDGYVMDTRTYCWPWKDRLRAANAQSAPDVYILRNLWDANEQLIDGVWVRPGDTAWQERYRQQLEVLVSIGNELENPPLILLAKDNPRAGTTLDAETLAYVNQVAEELTTRYANVQLLDFGGAACPGGECPETTSAGKPLYVDGAHFNETGKALLAPWLENQMARYLN